MAGGYPDPAYRERLHDPTAEVAWRRCSLAEPGSRSVDAVEGVLGSGGEGELVHAVQEIGPVDALLSGAAEVRRGMSERASFFSISCE